MFQQTAPKSGIAVALNLGTLIYHSAVRNVRKTHGNALMSLAINMLQALIFVLSFYALFMILGLRGAAIRGDFLVYIMSGIFLFMTFNKTMGSVVGSEGPASPMMKHAPMNTIVSIAAAALSTLYIQVLSLFAILFVYHVAFTPLEIDDPVNTFNMLMMAWFSGLSCGVVLLAAKPWAPNLVGIINTVFQRVNMFASGKMFVANSLPTFMVNMFDWNPLFHCIDQARGFAFVNYYPRNSSWEYPLYVSLVLLMIGLMGEFYTRKHASASWGARR